jgi:hypothetical protein
MEFFPSFCKYFLVQTPEKVQIVYCLFSNISACSNNITSSIYGRITSFRYYSTNVGSSFATYKFDIAARVLRMKGGEKNMNKNNSTDFFFLHYTESI